MSETTAASTGAKWVKPAILIALVAALLIAGPFLDVKTKLQTALTWMEAQGPVGLVLLAAIYVVACVLFIPGSILTLGAGFLAAALWPGQPVLAVLMGTVTVSIASVTGASAAFLLGRTLARDWVAGKVAGNPKFKALDDAVGANGFKMVFLVRLSPVFPFNLLNYGLGVTKVTFRHYLLASWIGMLPATVMYVYFGSVAQNLTALAAGTGEQSWAQRALLIIGLAATIALVTVVTRVARKALREAVPTVATEEG